MQVKYEFEPIELLAHMNLIGETYKLGSRPTETGRGKRLYREIIPEEYDELAQKMIQKCRYVYSHGAKENIILTTEEIVVLRMLIKYVCQLQNIRPYVNM